MNSILVRLVTSVILVCSSLYLLFNGLDKASLVRWDEYTNYRVVVDTINAQSFPLLKYNNQSIADSNESYFFEKPPAWYWLTMFVVKKFGVSYWSFRIVSAISGLGFLFMLFWIGKKISNFWGGVAAWAIGLLTPHFFLTYLTYPFSTHTLKSADLDSLQLFLIMLALNFFINLADKRQHPNRWELNITLASIFSALAYLTKGPFALIPAILFFSFYIIQLFREQNIDQFNLKSFGHQLFVYVVIMLLVAGSWHLWMIYKFGVGFINEYFIYHNIYRFNQPLEGHSGNLFTYIIYFLDKRLFLFGEISILALVFLINKFKAQILINFNLYFPIIGSIVVLLILTLTQTKLAWYLFYLYPFAILVIIIFTKNLDSKIKNLSNP